MYIIDKNKDFYDYISHIYGVDKQIIFDRRGSIVLDKFFFTYSDIVHHSYYFDKSEHLYCVLEIGFKQYLFEIKNIKIDSISCYNDIESFDINLLYEYDQYKHLFTKEMSLILISSTWNINRNYNLTKEKDLKNIKIENLDYATDNIIELPILKNTQFVKFLNSESVWMDINTFISSKKNDKNIDIINTDKDKVINHGFDVKSSFRNIK